MIFESIKVMKLKTDFSKRLIWQETSIWQETIERRQPRAKYNFELLFFFAIMDMRGQLVTPEGV